MNSYSSHWVGFVFHSSTLQSQMWYQSQRRKGKGSSNIKLLFLVFIKFLPRILNFSIYYFGVFLIKASLQSPLSNESLHTLMYLCKYTYPYSDRLTAVSRNQKSVHLLNVISWTSNLLFIGQTALSLEMGQTSGFWCSGSCVLKHLKSTGSWFFKTSLLWF